MKKILSPVSILFFLFINLYCSAQPSDEILIRSLENAEKEAILKGDTAMLFKLMSPQIVVHNPENAIVGLKQIIERLIIGK